MLKKFMASLGVGAAKVNLVLDRAEWRIGETMQGKLMVQGGSVDQDIHSLDVNVVLKFSIKGKEFTKIVDTIPVARDFKVRSGEAREIPFGHLIPVHSPISKGSVSYYLSTKMDIARAVDTGDLDHFLVLPGREMAVIMDALAGLGFKEKIGSGRIERLGQEFDYYPTALFADRLKELSFKFYTEEQSLKMLFELRLAGGFGTMGVKHYAELPVPPELLTGGSVERVAEYIKDFLEKELYEASSNGPRPAPGYEHYQRASGRPGFGGFIGGMAAGLLGAALLSSLFDAGEGDEAAEGDLADDEDGGGGFDFGGFDEEF